MLHVGGFVRTPVETVPCLANDYLVPAVHALRQAMTDSLDASGEQQVEDGGGSVGSSRSRKWLLRSSWLLKTAKKVARPSRNVLTVRPNISLTELRYSNQIPK